MELPKFPSQPVPHAMERIPNSRLYVELTDEDKEFWESQLLDTPEGRSRRSTVR
jgi:hypothetical protein